MLRNKTACVKSNHVDHFQKEILAIQSVSMESI